MGSYLYRPQCVSSLDVAGPVERAAGVGGQHGHEVLEGLHLLCRLGVLKQAVDRKGPGMTTRMTTQMAAIYWTPTSHLCSPQPPPVPPSHSHWLSLSPTPCHERTRFSKPACLLNHLLTNTSMPSRCASFSLSHAQTSPPPKTHTHKLARSHPHTYLDLPSHGRGCQHLLQGVLVRRGGGGQHNLAAVLEQGLHLLALRLCRLRKERRENGGGGAGRGAQLVRGAQLAKGMGG